MIGVFGHAAPYCARLNKPTKLVYPKPCLLYTSVLTDPAEASYYTVLGPMPIGLIGMLPVLAVAVWLTLRQMKQEEKN